MGHPSSGSGRRSSSIRLRMKLPTDLNENVPGSLSAANVVPRTSPRRTPYWARYVMYGPARRLRSASVTWVASGLLFHQAPQKTSCTCTFLSFCADPALNTVPGGGTVPVTLGLIRLLLGLQPVPAKANPVLESFTLY